MSENHEGHDTPMVCTPPRSWVLDDGTTIGAGSRVWHTAGLSGIVSSLTCTCDAVVELDGGTREIFNSSDLTTTPPPAGQGSELCGWAAVQIDQETRARARGGPDLD
jgi:hypothetical protein